MDKGLRISLTLFGMEASDGGGQPCAIVGNSGNNRLGGYNTS